jgi:hypothetical protein
MNKKMKKSILFFVLLMVASLVNAQLLVNSTGNIEIGSNPTSDFKFNLDGNSHFSGSVGIGNDPNSNYKLKLTGNSSFSGVSTLSGTNNFVGTNNFNGSCNLTNGYFNFTGPNSQYGPVFIVKGSNGYPGMWITTTSTFSSFYLLTIDGDAVATGVWENSDFQLKKNVTNLDGKLMLTKIANLNGKTYEFKSDEELMQTYKNNIDTVSQEDYIPRKLPKGERYGFIAQEIEKEFPELVKTDPRTNLKAVNYEGMIPILLESLKEQQKMIEELQKKMSVLSNGAKL